MMFFAMETLNQPYNILMGMKYRDLKKMMKIYLKLHPNKKKENLDRITKIMANFKPADLGWHS